VFSNWCVSIAHAHLASLAVSELYLHLAPGACQWLAADDRVQDGSKGGRGTGGTKDKPARPEECLRVQWGQQSKAKPRLMHAGRVCVRPACGHTQEKSGQPTRASAPTGRPQPKRQKEASLYAIRVRLSLSGVAPAPRLAGNSLTSRRAIPSGALRWPSALGRWWRGGGGGGGLPFVTGRHFQFEEIEMYTGAGLK